MSIFFKIVFFALDFLGLEVSDSGAVPRAGGLVDLGLDGVVVELGVVLQLELHGEILEELLK